MMGKTSPWCQINTVCFFGPWRCNLTQGWRSMGTFDLVNEVRSRRLTARLADEEEEQVDAVEHLLDQHDSEEEEEGEEDEEWHFAIPLSEPDVLEEAVAIKGAIAEASQEEDVTLMVPAQPLDVSAPSRRLLHPSRRTEIIVLFGLWAPASTPLLGGQKTPWDYDTSFEPENPWAQRAVMAMCQNHPLELYVADTDCWIVYFKDWLRKKERKFPSRSFHADMVEWFMAEDTRARPFLWFVERKLQACSLIFRANLDRDVGAERALEYKVHWDNFVADRNTEATLTGNLAFHVSTLWVRAEAQVAIYQSTTNTVIVECGVGFVGIFIFTGDPLLALFVLVLIISNISGLAFFMASVMGWAIGPIEIIFLVVFLGYSVTFGLHMANAYNQARLNNPELLKWEALSRRPRRQQMLGGPVAFAEFPELGTMPRCGGEARKARTRMALINVGGAVLSSTISTIGSSIFLLRCGLVLFIRLGTVIIYVTLLSVLSTLLVLPAVLMLCGPSERPCYKRLPGRIWRSCSSGRSSKDEDAPLLKK